MKRIAGDRPVGARVPISCDSLVALPCASASGRTVFAKNSDRPAMECQVLIKLPRRSHPLGSTLHCQYIDIPQAEETFSIIGSRPYWLWGLEHGVNEWGVVMGNHSVFTRDPLPERGLLGMDLVRLALERSRSASEAVDTITALIEQFGQGGSGYEHTYWPYHNSFLIADAREAWELETSGRHWCARKVKTVASLSNHLVIGSDWDRLSREAAKHATEQGWWDGRAEGRLDFARAYRDLETVPQQVSSGRHRRSCSFLSKRQGKISVPLLRELLRDHYDSGTVYHPGRSPEQPEYFSLCMHADPVGTTTASMILEQPRIPELLSCWACLGSPCVGVFLPYYMLGEFPPEAAIGGREPDEKSPWWGFKRLLSAVEADFPGRGPVVRQFWDSFESRVTEEARETEDQAFSLVTSGKQNEAKALLSDFMARNLRQTMRKLAEITRAIA